MATSETKVRFLKVASQQLQNVQLRTRWYYTKTSKSATSHKLHKIETEAVIFGTRQRLAGLDITGGVNVAGSTVQFNDALKLLGVTLDASLSFDKHVTNVVRACTFHTRALRHETC